MIDLTAGWVQHPLIPGGLHLVYIDSLVGEISIITGPKGSGLLAANDPGSEVTYEACFPGMCDRIGHLTLAELKGIIKFMRQREQERLAWQDED